MNAQQAIEWIHGARYKGEKVGLRNTRALLEALGNPDRGLNMVHVAGTNGKGSVCALRFENRAVYLALFEPL